MRIYGKVVDPQGNIVPSVKIAQGGEYTGGSYEIQSDASSVQFYVAEGGLAGNYMIVNALGTSSELELNIVFKPGRTISATAAKAEYSALMDNAGLGGDLNKNANNVKNGLNKLFGSTWGWLIGLGIAGILVLVFWKKIKGVFVSFKKKL
jgi:hypothetical protein